MADLYGTSSSPAAETEEMSTFLHQLLQSSSSKFMNNALSSPPMAAVETSSSAELLDRRGVGGRKSCINFSDPGRYYAKESAGNAASPFTSKRRGVSVENDLVDFICDREKGAELSEGPSDTVRPRSSSKRSRAAEIHNLSEKRRRSRINEKMKALQNLIPNSNKTDKASMLDEAIEYLKQLQLQVQMLTIRNGLSLHPMSLPGVLQPMQLPVTGMSFDEGSEFLTNTIAGAFTANEESSMQTALNIPNQATISNQSIVVPSGTNIISSETSFGFEPLIQVRHGPFNLSTLSKEMCREGIPEAQLDANRSAKTSSSSVS